MQALEVGRPGDLKEIFQCGPEPAQVRPNAWPEEMPEFRQTLLAFLEAAKASCDALMQAIALSLGLPGNFFVPYRILHRLHLAFTALSAVNELPRPVSCAPARIPTLAA